MTRLTSHGGSRQQAETVTEPGWRPDPNDPHRMRWWDGERWHDLTVPDQATTRERNRAVREARSSLRGLLKTVSAGTWTALGLVLYVIAALLIAAAITQQEGTGFGMNFGVALVALALLIVIYIIPALVIGGLVLWTLYNMVVSRTGGWAAWREKLRADRAARSAGLPTQRQAKRQKERARRAERVRSTHRDPGNR